jgi:phosphoribosyl-AMP cyclohydrolase / phosphoribosyl-ATP pyrophosphohydrolase
MTLASAMARTVPDVPADVRFGPDGLVPAIVVDAVDRAVLMLAWMNRESLERSLATGRTVFWSRSRQELWEKGATSGTCSGSSTSDVDCDADALLSPSSRPAPPATRVSAPASTAPSWRRDERPGDADARGVPRARARPRRRPGRTSRAR